MLFKLPIEWKCYVQITSDSLDWTLLTIFIPVGLQTAQFYGIFVIRITIIVSFMFSQLGTDLYGINKKLSAILLPLALSR